MRRKIRTKKNTTRRLLKRSSEITYYDYLVRFAGVSVEMGGMGISEREMVVEDSGHSFGIFEQ